MRIASQAFGSFRLMFNSLLDCQVENAGRLHTPPPSDVPGAGCQRDEKEDRTVYPPLCHILKANIQQDRLHEFASLFSHSTLPPAAVQ